MPTQQQLIKQVLTTIDDAVNQFNSGIPQIQKDILSDVILLVKDLDISPDGTIKNSVTNLRTIGKIKGKLESIVLNDTYLEEVKKFTDAFDKVAQLQNSYFNLIEKKFTPSKLLAEIQKQAINSTIESLTEAGIGVNVTEEIKNMLRLNITSGGKYSDLVSQLRNSMITNNNGAGLLERYTRQVTEDSIQQFNRQYISAISDDLSLDWFLYVGSNITTTREWCRLLTAKKYIHRSELSTIVHGNIDGKQVAINPKTHVWAGGIDDTNESNVLIYAGGYNCKHAFQPVSSAVIPQAIRAKFP